jgi:hypothetical protein
MKHAWLVMLLLVILAAPASVQAQFEYTINADNTLTVSAYTGPGGDVAIPTNFDGLTVTIIGTNAFADLTNLMSVTIPDGLLDIQSNAFLSCSSLTNVTISESVTNIGDYAFESCTSLTGVAIPGGVSSIGVHAFGFCIDLTNATINDGVMNIGDYAFANTSSLTNITIPGSVTNIGLEAFRDSSLISLSVANGVPNIGATAFIDCYRLAHVTIPSSVTNIGENAFGDCPSLTSVTIPGSVTSIGEFAFENDTGLTRLLLSNGVANITEGAFSGCSGLSSITIPGSVTNIDDYAFFNVKPHANFFFEGSPPIASSTSFPSDAMAYYLAGATAWSKMFAGLPAFLWNPLIQASGVSFGVSNNQFGFNITGTTNIPIAVEACTNLANPVWTTLQTITLSNGLFYFSEPLQADSSGRFYRIGAP